MLHLTANQELQLVLNLTIATLFGLLIGLERQKNGRIAGIRTFGSIALGTSLFATMAKLLTTTLPSVYIVAAIVVAAGIIASALTVQNADDEEQDFSNIAAVWSTVAITCCISFQLYVLGGAAATLLLVIFWFKDVYNKL